MESLIISAFVSICICCVFGIGMVLHLNKFLILIRKEAEESLNKNLEKKNKNHENEVNRLYEIIDEEFGSEFCREVQDQIAEDNATIEEKLSKKFDKIVRERDALISEVKNLFGIIEGEISKTTSMDNMNDLMSKLMVNNTGGTHYCSGINKCCLG